MAGVPQYIQSPTSQMKAGTAFSNYTTAKSVINPEDLVKIPSNYEKLGTDFKLEVAGAMSNIVTTPGTVTFQIMMGSAIAWTSGAIQLNATAHTSLPFWLDVDFRVDSTGSGTTAKFLGMGVLNGIMFTNTAGQTDSANTTGMFPVPATAPAVGGGFDSTIDNILDFWVGFSIANAGNGVQIYKYRLTQYVF